MIEERFIEKDAAVVEIGTVPFVRPLDATAQLLCGKRREAISARIASGIENRWAYCEMALNGEDEATSSRRGRTYKGTGPDGPFIQTKSRDEWKRSTAYFNITTPYVLLAAARSHDGLFPTDDRNWALETTPKQDVEDVAQWLASMPDEAEAPEALEGFLNGLRAESAEEVEKAQQQIDDWLQESPEPFSDVAAQVLENAAGIGTGAIEGPIPMLGAKGIQPGVRVVDAQNVYPDYPACGENIHDGDFLFLRKECSARNMRSKAAPDATRLGWLFEQVNAVLAEGPKHYKTGSARDSGDKTYELWTYQGEVPLTTLLDCGCDVPTDADTHVWANVTLCNDRIVRIGAATLDQFSVHVLPWRRRKGHWAGIGVAEDLEDAQRSINAQIRNLLDNSALSAVPQIVTWKGLISPQNGLFELVPGKVWQVEDENEARLQFVKSAIFTIEIPCRLDELRKNIDVFLALAEQVTGISGVVRGLDQPSSVGGGQIQMNAAAQNLRRVARLWDGKVLRPLIQAFVAWHKRFDQVSLAETRVSVFGSTVLVERDIQAQAVMSAVQLAQDPRYGHDPAKMMDQWLLAHKFDPNVTKLTPDRARELAALMQQDEGGSKGEAQVQSAALRAQALDRQSQREFEADQAKTASRMEDAARDRAHDKDMRILDFKMKLIEYAQRKSIDIDAAVRELEAVKVPEMVLEGAARAPAEAA